MASSPGSQPLPWGGIRKSTTLMCFQELRKRDQILSHWFYHSGSLRVWGSCEPGTVDEGQIYIYIYIYIYTHIFIFIYISIQLPSCAHALRPHGLQHARICCPSPAPGAWSNLCPLSRWYHPIVSFSVVPFSSRLQSFPASGSFPRSQFFTSGGQSIGASVSVLLMNIQGWFPLGLTGWISLQSKGLSRVPTPIPQLKASILWHSAFFVVHLSHPYTTTGKTIALTSKVIWPLLAK